MLRKMEAQLEDLHIAYTVHVFARLAPICMLSWCLLTKFLRRNSVESLLKVRCWLGRRCCSSIRCQKHSLGYGERDSSAHTLRDALNLSISGLYDVDMYILVQHACVVVKRREGGGGRGGATLANNAFPK